MWFVTSYTYILYDFLPPKTHHKVAVKIKLPQWSAKVVSLEELSPPIHNLGEGGVGGGGFQTAAEFLSNIQYTSRFHLPLFTSAGSVTLSTQLSACYLLTIYSHYSASWFGSNTTVSVC